MSKQTVIIKRVEGHGHDDHHGGGWKVAYADFMTAMMAFFLLLWILAASDEEKLRGLADYFTPSLSEAGGRGQGILAGQVLAEEGVLSGTDGPKSERQLPSFGQENPLAVFDSRIRYDEKYASAASPIQGGANSKEGGLSEEQATSEKPHPVDGQGAENTDTAMSGPAEAVPQNERIAEESVADLVENEQARVATLEKIQKEIQTAIATDPSLSSLTENVRFELSEQGLEIQIVDGEGRSMFAVGSAEIEGRTRQLIEALARSITPSHWPLVISGHTDSLQYASGATYTNWELSADRANATRRVLVGQGVTASRIIGVNAFADTNPIKPAKSDAPENRRIEILLHYPSELPARMQDYTAKIGPN